MKRKNVLAPFALVVACAAMAGASSAGAADITLENPDFRLVLGDDACAKSLVVKSTGEECVDASCKISSSRWERKTDHRCSQCRVESWH